VILTNVALISLLILVGDTQRDKVASTRAPNSQFSTSEKERRKDTNWRALQFNVTDAAGITLESQIVTVEYSYDGVHIGLVVVVAIIAVALSIFFLRLRSTRPKVDLRF
jgi:hypothetical protein